MIRGDDRKGHLFLYEIQVTRGRRKAGMRIPFLNKIIENRKAGYADYFVKMNKTPVEEKVG